MLKETLIFMLKEGITDTELENGTVIEDVHLIYDPVRNQNFIVATVNGHKMQYPLKKNPVGVR
jgi:hypothetical protein